jgi:hypothetical protein
MRGRLAQADRRSDPVRQIDDLLDRGVFGI